LLFTPVQPLPMFIVPWLKAVLAPLVYQPVTVTVEPLDVQLAPPDETQASRSQLWADAPPAAAKPRADRTRARWRRDEVVMLVSFNWMI
jgi:hypothetical protein